MEIVPIILIVGLVFSPILVAIFSSFLHLIQMDGHAIAPNYSLTRPIASILSLIGYPILFLLNDPSFNDCCSESASLSPDHRIGIYVLIVLSIVSFIVSIVQTSSKSSLPPITEVLTNLFLVIGILLNCVLTYHLQDYFPFVTGALAFLFIVQLVDSHMSFIRRNENNSQKYKGAQQLAWQFLNLPLFKKFPLIILLILPVFVILTSVLLLFGQEPDALIRAFTDTYKHGFSQLDYECNDVICPDDCYVCTIAAHGAHTVVRTERIGIRNGRPIKCSRQLLVASAFEKLWSDKLPRTHRIFRSRYDAFGRWLLNNPGIAQSKIISTLSYLLLKPAEWLFLLVLYTCYQKPENVIASRYLSPDQASIIEKTTGSHPFINPIDKIKITLK